MQKTGLIISLKSLNALTLLSLFCFVNCSPVKTRLHTESSGADHYSLADYSRVEKINTHVHIRIDDTTFVNLAANDNFRVINVSVSSPTAPSLQRQQDISVRLIQSHPNRVSYATTISVNNWNSETWQKETLDLLKDTFDKGAIAVKFWKNIGMDLRDKNGKFVMIDDPRFDPIIDFIENNHKTLIAHIGEPRNCWLPIEKMTVKGDKDYFTAHPQYHMYLHPEYPSYENLVTARDRMLAKHPRLKFVGAHLGSLEWSVDELAKRLDRFPNMAVDLAERISHLQYQAVSDWQKVHDFFIKYQDRLIYGTDQRVDSTQTPAKRNTTAHEDWIRHWRFFTTDEIMKVPKVENEFRGMKLTRDVVDKIYRKNAEKWFPSLIKTNTASHTTAISDQDNN